MKPRIAISGPDSGGEVAWFFSSIIVKALGGEAIRYQPSSYREKNFDFDALIIGGGSNVDEKYYDHPVRHPIKRSFLAKVFDFVYPQNIWQKLKPPNQTDPKRDEMELDLLQHAISCSKPVLGICRGHQLINVALGGSMDVKIDHRYPESGKPRSLLPVKKLRVSDNSLLNKITGETRLRVNALHNQAVEVPAPSLRPTAFEDNGLVQCIEGANTKAPVLGVQWHPEYLFYMKPHRALFQWLIEQAKMKISSQSSKGWKHA